MLWWRLFPESRFISDSVNGLASVVNVRCEGRPSFSNARIFANPDAYHVVVGIGKKDVNNVCLLSDSQEGATRRFQITQGTSSLRRFSAKRMFRKA